MYINITKTAENINLNIAIQQLFHLGYPVAELAAHQTHT